jgi:hypothetical protein
VEPLFLDLGTCFGQDIRKLVFDGVPVERLWASDIEQHLINVGFKMFNDKDKLPRSHFLCPGDLLTNSPEDKLNLLDDRVTILHLTAVFHLFTFDEQKTVADRCLRLLRKDTGEPVFLVGAHVGSAACGPFTRKNVSEEYSHKYRHNEHSWKELWDSVRGTVEWKDKIAKVELKSKLLDRGWNQNKGRQSTARKSGHDDSEMRWHMFEVWITFR